MLSFIRYYNMLNHFLSASSCPYCLPIAVEILLPLFLNSRFFRLSRLLLVFKRIRSGARRIRDWSASLRHRPAISHGLGHGCRVNQRGEGDSDMSSSFLRFANAVTMRLGWRHRQTPRRETMTRSNSLTKSRRWEARQGGAALKSSGGTLLDF